MAKSRTELMVARLRDLQASSEHVEAAAIVSVDGLSIASALPAGTEEDRVSAMSAAMLGLGQRMTQELKRGNLEQIFVRGESGFVVITAIGEEAVLTVLARKEAKLGMLFLDISRASQDLKHLI
ncbi:MAG: roadblock/LC7 domain-containing protein [Pleurocapsa minor GSE-CHR-MK-17-07R]|nr:roadblock/LC7 domain-containing protein [Pleurocapsa minor GSE-CHR-MK 17-07R]